MDIESALRVVGRTYGYAEIKDKQRDAILAFASGKDVFVSLPTGYGKSFATNASHYCSTPYTAITFQVQ